MSRNMGTLVANPAYAAIVAAVATLVAKYIDHRLGKKEDYLMDYLKAMIWSGALTFAIVHMITKPRMAGRVGNIMDQPF